MELVEMMRQFVIEHDAASDAANDLWAWLPSHHAAELILGDHSYIAEPCVSRMMRETTTLLAVLKGHPISKDEAIEWLHLGLNARMEHAPDMTESEILSQVEMSIMDNYGVEVKFK